MARHQHGGRCNLPPTSAPADTEDAGRVDRRCAACFGSSAVCAAADALQRGRAPQLDRPVAQRRRGVCSRIDTLTCSPVSPSAIWPDNIRRSASRCTLRGRRAAVLASRTSSTVVDPLDRRLPAIERRGSPRITRPFPTCLSSPEVPVADCFQFAKAALFPSDADLRLDRELLLRHCPCGFATCRRARVGHASAHRRLMIAASARGSLSVIEGRGYQPRPPIKLRPDRLGFDGEALPTSIPPRSTWRQWKEAVKLADHILGIGRSPIEYEDSIK